MMNLDVPVAMLNKERQNTQVRVSYDPFTHEYIPSRSRLNMGLGGPKTLPPPVYHILGTMRRLSLWNIALTLITGLRVLP
jgi:hypothetical protein